MEAENEFKHILNEKLNAKRFQFEESDWDAMHEKIDEWQSEKELSELLADKLGVKGFEFQENDWKEASLVLENSREQKRKPAVLWIFGLLLILLGGMTMYLWNLGEANDSKLAEVKIIPAKEKVVNKGSEEIKNETIVMPEKKIFTSDKKKEIEKVVGENRTVHVSGQKEKFAAAMIAVSEGQEEKVSKTEQQEEVKEAGVAENIPVQDQNKNVAEEKVSAVENIPMQNENNDKIEQVVSEEGSRKEQQDIPNDENTLAEKKSNSAEDLSNANYKNSEPGLILPEGKEQISNATIETPVTTTIAAINSTDMEVSEHVAETKLLATPKIEMIDTTSTLDFPDTAAAALVAVIKAKDPNYSHILSIEAGMTYFAGWKNEGRKEASGYTPLIGLQYTTLIRKNWHIDIAANYYYVGKLNYSNHTSKITSYSLGEENRVSVFTPVKLHYVGFPVKVHYKLKKHQVVGAGCNIAYLFNVSTDLYTYTYKANTVTDEKTTKTYGYTQGFKSLDPQLSIFYRRNIYDKLVVNTEFVFGLADIKDNNFFGANVYERNVGIRVTLLYNFWNK